MREGYDNDYIYCTCVMINIMMGMMGTPMSPMQELKSTLYICIIGQL